MKKCGQCGCFIKDNTTTCPLCNNVIGETAGGERTYPDIPERFKKLTFLKRMLLFASIVAMAICGFVDFQINHGLTWSLLVMASVLYGLFLLFLFFHPASGYQRRIFLTLFGGVLFVLLIDILTGFHGWSVNFVFPGAIFFVNIGLLLLMIINRRNWQSYMMHQIVVILIGIIPIILIYAGVVTYRVLSELAFLSSILVFVGTVIFGGRVARMELERRFHI